MAFYFQLFWLPAIVSAALLVMLWAAGELSDRSIMFLGGWFALATAAQYLATATVVWVAGLVLQTALAVYLALEKQITI